MDLGSERGAFAFVMRSSGWTKRCKSIYGGGCVIKNLLINWVLYPVGFGDIYYTCPHLGVTF